MTSSESPYRFEDGDGYSILALSPELNQVQWAEIEKIGSDVLDRLSDQKSPAFLIDLSALNYMGSALVALIVRIWKSIKEHDGRMVIVNRHQLVFEVLKLAGLHKLWSIVETREEGIEELGLTKSFRGGSLGAPWLIVIGLLALAGGGAGLCMLLNPPSTLDVQAVLAAVFGCSAVALIVGTISAVRQAGGHRVFGICVVVASLALVVTGICKLPGISN